MANMRGSKGNKKGFIFQRGLSEKINTYDGYTSAEVDDPSVYCESIGDTSRDKVDNDITRAEDMLKKYVSAKCPGGLGNFQMSSLTIDRQIRYLEHVVGYVPQIVKDFCYAYFGHIDYETWKSANEKIGIDTSTLSEEECRRQRTFGKNISKEVKSKVESYFNDIIAAKTAFFDMHLASGFTDKSADFQIYHPAKTKEDIDYESNNFYVVDLNILREMSKDWVMKIGSRTTNFGPLNWKVRGGGGDRCTPTKGSYHNAQCFSGISKMKKFAGTTKAFFKGTLPEAIEYMYGKN
jgi:hypothetical protein